MTSPSVTAPAGSRSMVISAMWKRAGAGGNFGFTARVMK